MGDRVCQAGLRTRRAWRRLFPLPEGEGQGEGERRFDRHRVSPIQGTPIMKTNLNRREFIRAGSGALAAVALAPSHLGAADSAAAPTKRKIMKGIMYATVGVKIAIENVWNHFLLSPLEAARYVDEFNSPWVGWHFDVGNVITYGWPEQWIRVLGKRIQKLHIKEFSREKANKEGLGKGFSVEFLKGDNNWPAVMKALDEIGYDGWGIAEQWGADSAEGLKKLSEEMDRIFAS